jgi:hypothetical protein
MVIPKPSFTQIMRIMVKDPMMWASILLTAFLCVTIINNIPPSNKDLSSLYYIILILIGFTLYSRFELANKTARIAIKYIEVEKTMRELKNLIKKTKNPVAYKKEQEKGEFQ